MKKTTGVFSPLPLLLLLLPLLAGCGFFASPQERMQLRQISFAEISGWDEDNGIEALRAFSRSCEVHGRLDPQQMVGSGILKFRAEIWQEVCRKIPAEMADINDDVSRGKNNVIAAKKFFLNNFTPFVVSYDGSESALLTGYFEPLLYGSRKKQGRYRFPLYRLPPDMVAGEPYFSRRQIDEAALAGRDLELLWVDDEIALFFLHIQGSGLVQLTDNTMVRVGYAGKNGHPYYAIGRELLKRGALSRDNVSMLAIKHWLWNHPAEIRNILWLNPSYIFFREIRGVKGKEGAIGSQGVVLTPLRSLAVDNDFIPAGMPVFVQTTLPSPPLVSPQNLSQLMIAQDSGSAIKGALRGDIFFGSGNEAGIMAGFMKQKGKFILLVPRKIFSGGNGE